MTANYEAKSERLIAAAGGVGAGWGLLPADKRIEAGDGFVHPDNPELGWIDYVCRPDLFRGKREYVHSGWPWRRKLPATHPKEDTNEDA